MAIPNEPDPFTIFHAWLDEAMQCDALSEPTAMVLSTVDQENIPDSRVVLYKGIEDGGFVFFTNLTSAKAVELSHNPYAALCFYWMPLDKQIRIRGHVEPVSDALADAYFADRPKQSQIGAWASKQSTVYTERFEFERRIAKYGAKYAIGKVPRPDFWSGFRVVPSAIEFWLKQPYRLHDRLRYLREDGGWRRERLYP
ncbi:MAG: pyridoxamine 5'-phosphate oxidase [Candidatus Hydrogenedentes bacterium]|nr:pyridoxamine 5'-phosphate oxidase [Candidatus Hydrogenedentota bacterium]